MIGLKFFNFSHYATLFRRHTMKFDSKAIAATFFEKVSSEEKGNATITKFKCQCGAQRTQNLKKGYQNLISHIKDQHKNWEEIMESKHLEGTSKITQFVNRKASTIFSWLEWIVMANLPFQFVENTLTRKNSKLEHISTDTLMKYLKLLTAQVEIKVSEELPPQFGIVIDGWTEGNRHYIAVFACYSIADKTKAPLLAIAPPYDEENYDAASHKAFIGDVLELFKRGIHDLLFLVGDNAPVNKSLANLLGVPFIGCASHRFNLACKMYLVPFESSLSKINDLMKTLGNIKQAAKLRKSTDLEPIKRNVTRWSSTFQMLRRFFEIKSSIDEKDPELACNLPSGQELLQLQKIMADLREFETITKQLQNSACTMSEVRAVFDTVIQEYPSMDYYLGANAQIVHSPTFENGIVKVMDDAIDDLSNEEKDAVVIFRKGTNSSVEGSSTCEGLTIVQRALKNKRRKVINEEYCDLTYVPPTSNIVERLFSKARLVLTDYRKSMTPYTFECVMFLKMNQEYWDLDVVANMVGN